MTSQYVYISKECCICLQTEKENTSKFFNFKKNKKYTKKCKCNVDIHKKCLDDWFYMKMSCPLCNTKIHHKKTICKKISNILVKIFSQAENAIVILVLVIIIMSYVIKPNSKHHD